MKKFKLIYVVVLGMLMIFFGVGCEDISSAASTSTYRINNVTNIENFKDPKRYIFEPSTQINYTIINGNQHENRSLTYDGATRIIWVSDIPVGELGYIEYDLHESSYNLSSYPSKIYLHVNVKEDNSNFINY